jgi:hypothetical protein
VLAAATAGGYHVARRLRLPPECAPLSKRLALLTACLLLAAAPASAGDAEDAAARAVQKDGGTITRDDSDPAHPVVAVSLAFLPATDAQLQPLTACKSLKSLDLTLC